MVFLSKIDPMHYSIFFDSIHYTFLPLNLYHKPTFVVTFEKDDFQEFIKSFILLVTICF
mgnify:CR=1 FL=1